MRLGMNKLHARREGIKVGRGETSLIEGKVDGQKALRGKDEGKQRKGI